MTDLSALQDRIRRWLFEAALPLWGATGAGQGEDGLFAERLDFEGRPVAGLARRTRVQARQVYVFCAAEALGWPGGAETARRGLDALIAGGRRDDGLWISTRDAQGAPLDRRADLYDQAFVLFALAAAHRALGDGRARPLALETLAAIQTHMAADHGGWVEALPPVLPRRQNPHMHMLEAMLAWTAAAPDPAFEAAAGRCLDLMQRRFLHPQGSGCAIAEYFTHDWRPDPETGVVTEPGHSFEWAWLLSGIEDGTAARLHDQAQAAGLDGAGFVVRELDAEGRVRDGGRRLWAQTEAVRTLWSRGDRDRAARLLEAVFATHLDTAVPGLWVDSFDEAGRPLDREVPASSLYHLMTAFSEVLGDAR